MNLLQPPQRLDALAREYATGTLHGGARRRFERLLLEEAAARRAVAAWQQDLATLAVSVPPLAPGPQVWNGLQQRLWQASVAGPAGPARPAPVSQPPRPGLDRSDRPGGGWRTLWAWLGSGRSWGSALAGVLLAVVVLRQQPDWAGLEPARDGLPASYVGLLTDVAGKPAVLASSRRQGRQLTIKLLQPLAVPDGRVAQLWALPKGGGAPVPIGVVPAGTGSVVLPLAAPSEALFFGTERLAVSLEPAPAAAGAKPSADFVLSGFCVKLW
jgi:anti-sigma-K factor RskA